VLLVLLAVIVLWESGGRRLRRRFFRLRGGHVVLAGIHDDLSELANTRRSFAGTFFLAPDRAAATDLARRRPFAEIVPIENRKLGKQLTSLGASKARLLAAATRNDLTNVAIAEAGLAARGQGELLVRLEQHSVRSFQSHRLRVIAAEQQRQLAVVSLTQLQARRGLAAAMPGRYTLDGAERVHIALCGSGDALQAASFEIARQGYGLESDRPLVSILRTGSSDFAAGALDRLQKSGIAQIAVTDVNTAAADGLDRAIGDALKHAPPLIAVHCIGQDSGEAEALALRWEEVLLTLHQPIPPIVAYAGQDHPLGTTGMIRIAAAQDLAQARESAHLMDRRARAVHREYLEGVRLAGGVVSTDDMPAAIEWEQLPESVQDDNRNAADQMDYALASVFMLAEPGEGSAAFDRDEIEVLSGIAHSRWMAAKGLAGWRHGPDRDDRLMLHPDMLPYTALDEPTRQKDRDIVASIPDMAALAGETLKRERRIGVPRPLDGDAYESFLADLRRTAKASIAVVVIPLDGAEMVRFASRLAGLGVLVEAMLDKWVEQLRDDDAVAAVLADVLRRAWRIHVVRDGDARSSLDEQVSESVSDTGVIDVFA
jgi:hypothetical protein